MRHSLSKDTAFNGATRNVCPLAIPESCAQNMGLRLLENHSLKQISRCIQCVHVFDFGLR